jgi:hypothetical protein
VAISLPPLLALRGLRKTAVAAAVLPALYLAFHAIRAFAIFQATPYGNTDLVWYPIFFAAEAITLAISPGPRRASTIMTGPARAVTAAAGGLAGLTTVLPVYQHTGTVAGVNPVTLTLIAAAAATAIMRVLPAPVGKRLIILAAIPGYPAVIAICGIGAQNQAYLAASYSLGLIYLPAIALTCLAGALAWWSHRCDSATS